MSAGVILGIFGAAFATVFVPVPEEVVLLGVGVLAHSGAVPLWAGFLAAYSAILAGDGLTFLAGRTLLRRLLELRLVKRLLKPAVRAWTESLVRRHGLRAVVLGRFLVALRGPVYLAIGESRFPVGRFFVVDASVALFEVGLVVGIGYAFHAAATAHVRALDAALVATALVVVGGWFLARRAVMKRAVKGVGDRHDGGEAPPDDALGRRADASAARAEARPAGRRPA